MYIVLAMILIAGLTWYAQRDSRRERQTVAIVTDDEARNATLQGRQDLKLIAFLLGAILLMLGVIADQVAR
jgi:hypothetical protein